MEYDNRLTDVEEAQLLLSIEGQPFGGMLRTQQAGLTALLPNVIYTGEQVACVRRKVDELDNITVWRI